MIFCSRSVFGKKDGFGPGGFDLEGELIVTMVVGSGRGGREGVEVEGILDEKVVDHVDAHGWRQGRRRVLHGFFGVAVVFFFFLG